MENTYSVIKIETCPCSSVNMHEYDGKALLSSHNFQAINCLKVPAELSLSESMEEGEKVYRAELKFTTRKELELSSKNMAYRVTCADGTKYIMGKSTKPFPITLSSRKRGEVNTNQLPGYTVTLVNVSPLPIQQ